MTIDLFNIEYRCNKLSGRIVNILSAYFALSLIDEDNLRHRWSEHFRILWNYSEQHIDALLGRDEDALIDDVLYFIEQNGGPFPPN